MKHIYKITIAVALLCCAAPAVAQQPLDTVPAFDLRYYRNCYDLHDDDSIRFFDDRLDYRGSGGQMTYLSLTGQRVAFRFVADSTLHVLGVAGAMCAYWQDHEIHNHRPFIGSWNAAERDSVMQLRVPEWFEVYQVRAGDSLELLASAAWTLNDTDVFTKAHVLGIVSTDTIGDTFDPNYQRVIPVIERYFNKDVTVHDSFYVGYTNFNHDLSYRAHSISNDSMLDVFFATTPYQYLVPVQYNNPHQVRDSCHSLDADNPLSHILYQLPTSETHFYEPWQNFDINFRDYHQPILFPIIDTTGFDFSSLRDTATCDTVEGFRVLDQSENHASFAWTPQQGAAAWQLSWGPEGTAPGGGTLQMARTNVCTVSGLQEGVHYVAYVRTQCNDTLYGDWSAPLPFWMGMTAIESPAPIDAFIYLIPNPASGKVTVASSFHMSRVELFSLDGRQLLTSQANALALELDISGLPAATYMVRITTPAGIAVKRLVVR